MLNCYSFSVGRKIITKKVGYISEAPDTRDAEDITDKYKNKEGSAEERMSVLNAARAGGLAYLFEIPEPGREDIKFELVKIERVPIGQPFYIIVRMYNKATTKRTITLSVNVNTVYYTGILAHNVKNEQREIDVGPGKGNVYTIICLILLLRDTFFLLLALMMMNILCKS